VISWHIPFVECGLLLDSLSAEDGNCSAGGTPYFERLPRAERKQPMKPISYYHCM
jgi:hypothetical protein